MEEPDVGGDKPEPITFTATGKDNAGSSLKKEAKRSTGERLRARKTTLRPETKGSGKKRYILTPSPKIKPVFKRATTGEGPGKKDQELLKKRNLMGELNKVAERIEEEVSRLPEKSTSQLQQSDASAGEQGKGLPESKSGASTLHAKNLLHSERVIDATQDKKDLPTEDSSEKMEAMATAGQTIVAKCQGRSTEVIPRVQNGQAGLLEASHPNYHSEKKTNEGGKSKRGEKPNMESGWSNDVIPFVSCFDNDLYLDLATFQPLLIAYTPQLAGQRQKSTEVTMLDAAQPVANQELDTNFPTLKQGITKSIRAKFEGMLQGSNAWAQQAQSTRNMGRPGSKTEKEGAAI